MTLTAGGWSALYFPFQCFHSFNKVCHGEGWEACQVTTTTQMKTERSFAHCINAVLPGMWSLVRRLQNVEKYSKCAVMFQRSVCHPAGFEE